MLISEVQVPQGSPSYTSATVWPTEKGSPPAPHSLLPHLHPHSSHSPLKEEEARRIRPLSFLRVGKGVSERSWPLFPGNRSGRDLPLPPANASALRCTLSQHPELQSTEQKWLHPPHVQLHGAREKATERRGR